MRKTIKCPSVTQVLSKYQDFSNVPPERLELAADRGKAVHTYCAAYARGLWVPVPEEGPGYCQSFRRWFDEYVQETFTIEETLCDETFGFTGTPDWSGLLLYDNEWPTVVDWKTPLALQVVWEGQIAAYMHLANCKRGGSLRLDPNGKMPRFKEYTENKRAFQAFLNALTAHKYFTKGD